MKPLILASSSPRRKELLQLLQMPFTIISSDADETLPSQISPEEAVKKLSLLKAKAVFGLEPEACVIGADTIVVLGDKILGKPKDRQDARQTLEMLSGKKHEVLTGVSIVAKEKTVTFYEKTEVVFWDLTKEEIENYLDTGDPFDKAGSYGIQGFGSVLVKEIKGDYFSVVGLPVARLSRELRAF
ncbi:Maf family protein [Peribacillus kribbensis]|uniref:Maf family protein n=1 Tax=Peribacillus kribbensis TaxID=356658 RepID=UPI0004063292|nr:Maf family protein [Peribacillus kribbensis]